MVWIRRHSAVAIALASLAVLVPPTVARGETVEQFCAPMATSRSTAELLLEPEGEFPAWGLAPIGPGKGRLILGTRFVSPEFPSAVAVGRPIFYPILLQSGKHDTIRLRWTLDVRVSRLASPGRTVRSAERRIGVVQRGRTRRVRLPAVDSPGAYRYDLTVRDGGGKVKRRLSLDRPILRNAVALRLATFGDTFRVGDSVSARIENYGSESARYTPSLGFERLENGTWVEQSFEALFGSPGIIPLIGGLRAEGGFTSGCSFVGFMVPPGMTPGRYRMVKEVDVGGEALPLTAEFTIAE